MMNLFIKFIYQEISRHWEGRYQKVIADTNKTDPPNRSRFHAPEVTLWCNFF